MKVAIIANCFPVTGTPLGGVSAATYQLCQGLQARKDADLIVIRPLARKETLEEWNYRGIQVVPLPYRKYLTRPVALLWHQGMQVRAALRQIQPDIVHIQDSSILDRFIAGPKVFTLHGLVERDARYERPRLAADLRSFLLRLTYGRARQSIRNVITISPYTRSVLKPFADRRVWNIPNAIDDSFFRVTAAPGTPFVLFAGRMTLLKNVAILIRGFSQAAREHPKVELRLAGPDQQSPYARECRLLVNALGLERRVRFLGNLDTAQLQRELTGASVLALCSLQENAPMAVAEAMAAGVPVVASRIGGIPWMLDDGRAGLLVDDPRNPEAVAMALRQALDPETQARVRLAGKARAEMFRSSRVAEQTMAVYREILQSDRTRR